MPESAPPRHYTGTPNRYLLPAGTQLWRVHRRSRKATDFTSRIADQTFGVGRFDSTPADPYSFYYAGLDATTALAEVFLRSLPFDTKGDRTIKRASVRGRRASSVVTTQGLTLVSLLTAADLAAVAQDEWLIHADGCHYPQTRRWASWLRKQAGWANGFIWPSKRDAGKSSVVLFEDRCVGGVLDDEPLREIDLDDEAGAAWLNEMLALYRVCVRPPSNDRSESAAPGGQSGRHGGDSRADP